MVENRFLLGQANGLISGCVHLLLVFRSVLGKNLMSWPVKTRAWLFAVSFRKFSGVQHFIMFIPQFSCRWWFQISFIFIPIWGRFPIWLICFKGVETTNQSFSDNMNLPKRAVDYPGFWWIWRFYESPRRRLEMLCFVWPYQGGSPKNWPKITGELGL